MGRSVCKYCGQEIVWAKDAETGAWVPCNPGYLGTHRCKGQHKTRQTATVDDNVNVGGGKDDE